MAEQTEHGSFLTGFTIGLFAGAAGYFLFATDKGSKVRKSLSQEWQAAQQSWLTHDQVSTGTATLRDLAQDFFTRILGTETTASKARSSHDKDGSAKKPVVSKKPVAAPLKKNTFKGV